MKRTSKAMGLLTVAGALSMGSVTADAALFDRGGGMIYDSDLNITWLQDWNVNGLMVWDQANTWASQLRVGGYSDWRLPISYDSWCLGYGCASEISHMFYDEFGATSGHSILAGTNTANLQLFRNIRDSGEESSGEDPIAAYWTGTPYTGSERGQGAYSEMWTHGSSSPYGGGYQSATGGAEALFAVAVRNGDAVAVVPEPETWALILLGLGAVAQARKRRSGRRS